MPKSQEIGDYYFEFGVDIFEEVQGLDVSMLREPVAKIFFNTFTKKFDYDYNYTAKINNDVKALYKNYEALKKLEKKSGGSKKEVDKVVVSDTTNKTAVKTIPEILFSVELLSSAEQVDKNSSAFKGIVNVKEYKDDAVYRYYVGSYSSLADAEKMKQNMVAHFPNATIIAFKGGKKMSAEEVLNAIEK